jgi:diacylglycerol diphosphate phosphatase/phosphatidate phosphatase
MMYEYRQYYPPLNSELSHRPYGPRVSAETFEDLLPIHNPQPSVDHPPSSGGVGIQAYRVRDDSVEMADGTVPRKPAESLESIWKRGSAQE